jgi:microcystin-dependent protein
MTVPFVGQIQSFGFNFAPTGWATCDGQILAISQNTALFSLLGTQYGGNGTSNFALPDLRSRVPVNFGTDGNGTVYTQGQVGGVEAVTLNSSQVPSHSHAFIGTMSSANSVQPVVGAALAMVHHQGGTTPDFYYAPDTTPQALNPMSLSPFGNVAPVPHANVQPYLTINWCIALTGVFPARN